MCLHLFLYLLSALHWSILSCSIWFMTRSLCLKLSARVWLTNWGGVASVWKCTSSAPSRSQIFSGSERSSRSLFPLVIPAGIPSSTLVKTGAAICFPADTGLLPFPTSTVLVQPRINSTYLRRCLSMCVCVGVGVCVWMCGAFLDTGGSGRQEIRVGHCLVYSLLCIKSMLSCSKTEMYHQGVATCCDIFITFIGRWRFLSQSLLKSTISLLKIYISGHGMFPHDQK